MNVYMSNDTSSSTCDRTEGLLAKFERSDTKHSVFAEYGKTTAHFYQAPNELELDGQSVGQWLALPMKDSLRQIIGIAFLSQSRAAKPLFYPHPYPTGCVVFGTPSKEEPLFVVSSPEVAFAISLTGFSCLLAFTPYDWGGKHSPEAKDAGNMAYVIKTWSTAGYAKIYVPVGCDMTLIYQKWLTGLAVHVMPLQAPISQYIETSYLKEELTTLIETSIPIDFDNTLEHDLKRLASLPIIDYERCRSKEAKRLQIRANILDKLIKPYKAKYEDTESFTHIFPHVELWSEHVDGAPLLDEITSIVTRHIVCDKTTIHAIALWIVFTWCIDVMHVSPIACITAPEKRCGKTQLLNLIGMLCKKPLPASNITAAAIYRSIDAFEPTLLIDEADSFLRQNDELRGIINSGHTRQSAFVIRTVGDNFEPKRFSTWGAKAISGIGHLSDTLKDRSILIELRRKRSNEHRDRLRHADTAQFEQVISKLARWAEDNNKALRFARPELPDALNDRAQDNWESLLAIADQAGSHWPKSARHAALTISGIDEKSPSINEELLTEIKIIFERLNVSRVSSNRLLDCLCQNEESPWATWSKGNPMSPRQLSNRLKDFGISSKNIREGSDVCKGYELSDFKDAFSRYLKVTPKQPATPLQTGVNIGSSENNPYAYTQLVAD